MNSVVHVRTVIRAEFGLIDEAGNVVPQQPIVVVASRFSAEAFTEAHALISQARDEATAAMPKD